MRENLHEVERPTRSRTHVDFVVEQPLYHAYRFVLLKKKEGWRIDSVKRKNALKHFPWGNVLIGS